MFKHSRFMVALARLLHASPGFSAFITGPIVIVAAVICFGAATQWAFMDQVQVPAWLIIPALAVIMLQNIWWRTLGMAESNYTLTLSSSQLYEVYNAAWREFVALHRHVTTNPNGAHEAVIERARQSRTAIGEVCDMIEALYPELKATRDDYTKARAEAKQAPLSMGGSNG